MSLSMASAGGPLAYRGPQAIKSSERTLALCVVLILHALFIAVLVVARANPPVPPESPTLSVSLITESSAPAPVPASAPQPVPTPPETRMIATPRPTPSPMAAAPLEKPVQPQVSSAAPSSPAAPAAAAASSAPSSAITPPNFTAAYLRNPGAVYPPSSRRKREEGTVRLRVQVSAEGAPLQVLVDRSSGSKDLDQAAQDVVGKRWKFAPAKQGDRAVAAWVIVPMEFSLKR